jgi:hypothetical protein
MAVVETVAGDVDGFVAESAARSGEDHAGGRDGGADDLALVAVLAR